MAKRPFLDRLRGRDQEAGAAPAPVPERGEATDTAAPRAVLGERGDFDAALSRAVADHPEVAGAGIHLLGLAGLKSRYGKHWPMLRDKTLALTRRVIDAHLTPGAFYKIVGDDKLILAFPDLDPVQARLKLALIAEKINDMLVGEKGERLVDVLSGATLADASFVAKDDAQRLEAVGVGEIPAAPAAKPLPDWLTAAPELDAQPGIAEMGFVFRPMWAVARKRVSTYLCQPAVTLTTGKTAIGEEVLDFWDVEAHGWKIDIACLKAAARAAQNALINGSAATFATSVHWHTMRNAAQRARYLSAAWQISTGVRNRLALEIKNVPELSTEEGLRNAVQSLRPVSRALILCVAPGWRQMESARRLGINLVGFDAKAAGLSESQLHKTLPAFRQAARRSGMGAYVHGLTRLSTTVAAVEAGYHFLDGDTVAPVTANPEKPFALAPDQVLGGKAETGH